MYNPIDSYQSEDEHLRNENVITVCQRYKSFHVIAHTATGSPFDGIIDDIDADGVTMLVPEDIHTASPVNPHENRQFGLGGGYFRRFHRRRFPFQSFVYPFFVPLPYLPPYYYPPYPVYPGYSYYGY